MPNMSRMKYPPAAHARVKALLEEAALHHMTGPEEQAEVIGISYKTLKKVKAGYGEHVSFDTVEKVAAYLGVEARRLHAHMLTGEALS